MVDTEDNIQMMREDTVNITLEEGSAKTVKRNTPVRELLSSAMSDNGLCYLGALINNEVSSLETKLESDAKISFIDMRDPEGWRIYRDSVAYLLNMAVYRIFPDSLFTIEHSFGTGYFCRFENKGIKGITDAQIEAIEETMRNFVDSNLSIEKIKIPFQKAINEFLGKKQVDKYKLLRFRNPPYIEVYRCDGFYDLAHGVLASNTGMAGAFKCIPHKGGFVLQFATRENAPRIAEFHEQPNLFNIFQEHKQWGRILGVRTAGDLNQVVADGDIAEFIRTAEALHEKKISSIADQIADNKEDMKWIFIAGPSSSGKTTFAKRLAVQLRLNGMQTTQISIDDYFVERNKTPKNEKGEFDFENITSVDVDFLHEQLEKLDQGKEVFLPHFDFTNGKRKFSSNPFGIGEDEVVIVEGIHGLNPLISDVLPTKHTFKIYISALTQLNLDYHNRLSTTDNRLMRRIVRDYKFRGHNAIETFEMWPNVRQGEKEWIFPYQEQADAAFNSALDYEIPVLKLFIEPLLLEVKPYHAVYPTARRLIDLLANFLNIHASLVPPTSILREFIGRSSFRY